MGSRSLDKAQSAIKKLQEECPESENTVEAVKVDLASDDSIQAAFEQVKAGPGHIDALINNAGEYWVFGFFLARLTWSDTHTSKTGATFDLEFVAGKVSLRECFMKAYDVNVAGTNVLTWTFMPLLLKSSDPRLIFVTGLSNVTQASRSYFPTPPQPAGWPKKIDFETIGYRCSKTALNMLMVDWNHKLKADGVKVWSLGPGMLETDLGNARHMAKAMGAKPASIGGQFIRTVVEGERDADVGKIVVKDGISEF